MNDDSRNAWITTLIRAYDGLALNRKGKKELLELLIKHYEQTTK